MALVSTLGCLILLLAVLASPRLTAILAPDAQAAANFEVNDTGDSGPGTFRQAILDANANPGTDTISFNLPPGSTIQPTSALPNLTQTVEIDAGCATPKAVELDGSLAGPFASGLATSSTGNLIRGLAINRFANNGINLYTGSNRVECSFIGTDPSGTIDRGNGNHGIDVAGNNNTIGGAADADGNLISGHSSAGIRVANSSGTQIGNNLIGTDAGGDTPIPNNMGVSLASGATTANIGIGGAAGNVISGNDFAGIDMSGGVVPSANIVQGNYIGTDDTGTTQLDPTPGVGIAMNDADNNTIGGGFGAPSNVISGNQVGIQLTSGANGNEIVGNLVGVTASGTGALGNSGDGIVLVSSSSNSIGGTAAGTQNVVANNGATGVLLRGGTGNAVLRNSIHSNAALGIDLPPGAAQGADGVTANDSGDADVGSNDLQNFPVLTSAAGSGPTTTVNGSLNSEAAQQYRLEFFSSPSCDASGNGEGETFLGSETVTTDGSGNVPFSADLSATVATGDVVTATATEVAADNTSEFSGCVELAGVPVADLRISKTDSPDPVIAGTPLTYTLTVTNDGPSEAGQVSVGDDLPGAMGAAQYCTGTGCTPDTPWTGSVDIGTLAADASEVIRITGTVDPATAEGDISNAASVTGDVDDPNAANDDASENTAVIARADVHVVKSDSPDPVLAGDELTYDLEVTNDGPSNAQAVQVSDGLSPELSGARYCVGQGCDTFTQPWTGATALGTMAPGQSRVVRIRARVRSDTAAGTQIESTASVTTGTTDPNPSNDSAAAQTDVDVEANVDIFKSDGPDPVRAGTQLTYALRINNYGPSDAQDVQVTDNLPAPLTGAMYCLGEGCQNFTQPWTGSIDLGTMTSGTFQIVRIRSTVPANTANGFQIVNTATVSTSTPDPNLARNTHTQRTNVITRANLVVDKADDPDPVIAGTPLAYTITLRNDGPSDAQAVSLNDALPAGLSDARYCVGSGCSVNGFSPSWTGSVPFGTLAPGESREVRIVATVDPSVLEGAVLHNVASPASTTVDPDPSNAGGVEDTAVIARAELGITKLDDPDPVIAGNRLAYTILATNHGPSDAQDVFVRDNLPDELTGAQYCVGAGCVIDGSSSAWTLDLPLGTLAAGDSREIRIEGTIAPHTPDGAIGNIAEIFSTTTDPGLVGNSFHQDTEVITRADLEIVKSDDPDPVIAGNRLAYTINLVNRGPSDAQAVSVADDLPGELNGARYCTGSGCAIDGSSSDWTGAHDFGLVRAGESREIRIEATVDPSVLEGEVIHNEATATSTTIDSDPGDNTEAEDTDVLAEADVSLASKLDEPDPVIAGNDLTYILRVTNDGPSDAQSVTVTDTLSSRLSSARFCTGDPCTVDGSSPAWTGATNLGTVAAGSEHVIRIVARVNPSTPRGTVISNEATVSGPTTDPGPGPNAAAQDTDVITQANIDMTKSDGQDPVIAGNQLTYALRVTNHGPSDAQDVEVFDDLPPQLVNANFCLGEGCFDFDQPWTGSLALGTIPADGTRVVRIRSTVLASTPDSPPALLPPGPALRIRNTASTTTSTDDPSLDRNTHTQRTDVITRADLSIRNDVQGVPSDNKFAQGGNVTYHLTVDNAGPSDARNVVVSKPLPSKMNFVSASHGGAAAGSSVTWNLGTMPPSDPPQTLTVTLSPNAAAGDPFGKFGVRLATSASISSTTTDPNLGDNADSSDPIKVCTLLGDDGPNTLTGTSGDDWICGRGGTDVLDGMHGNDVVQGNDGDDRLDDTQSNPDPGYSTGNDILEAGNGSDTVNGGQGEDRLSGGFFAESVAAGEGSGADDGKDTLTYRNAPEKGGDVTGVSVRLQEGQAFHLQSGLIVRDELWKNNATDNTFEDVVGSEFADDLIGDGDNNFLAGRGCGSTVCTGVENSYYRGRPTGQREQGGDVLHGRQGNDILTGASGNDALRGGAGTDTLNGGLGHDLLAGGLADSDNDGVPDTSPDTLNGGDGLDIAWYLGALNTMRVNLSNNTQTFAGGGIAAHRATGEGVDILGTDIENIKGSSHPDGLFGDDRTNSIDGSGGNDSIFGLGGDDRSNSVGIPWEPPPGGPVNINNQFPGLAGGAGNDTINGGNGHDLLVGGSGTDGATGGPGNDICYERESGVC